MPETPATRIQLRPFALDDAHEVTTWFTDAGALRHFAGPRLKWPLTMEQWERLQADPELTLWTAINDAEPSEPLGHAEFAQETDERVRFARIAIKPQDRGNGLGRAMVQRMVEMAREQGYQEAVLFVHPDNTTAIRAYRSLGFLPVAEEEKYDSLRMHLNLVA